MASNTNNIIEMGRTRRNSTHSDDAEYRHKDEVELHLLSPEADHHRLNSVGDLLGLAPKRHYTSLRNLSAPFSNSVRYLEVLPTQNRTQGSSWRMPLHLFSDRTTKALGVKPSSLPKGIRTYYQRQDELILAYENTATESKFINNFSSMPDIARMVTRLSQISFAVNLMLMIAKAVAVGLSNSLSIISSLVDSVVDLLSGIIIWWTTHAIKSSNIYVYPVGRSRLEPVAIIILSVIMSLASLEVMISSVRKIVAFTNNLDGVAVFELPTILIAASTVVVKFALALSFYLVMRRKNMSSAPVDALILDHRNDTISNLVAIICGYLGSKQFAEHVDTMEVAYIDPVGAITIAIYIIVSWWQTGITQLKMITGYTANPAFLSQITWIALNHSPKIICIDTVRAFHFGTKFLVEVDIVLKEDTVLMESHNIGESLQQKLEKLDQVERAFVHVDYEVDHRPQEEHLSQSLCRI